MNEATKSVTVIQTKRKPPSSPDESGLDDSGIG
jgi:hypothetical protein